MPAGRSVSEFEAGEATLYGTFPQLCAAESREGLETRFDQALREALDATEGQGDEFWGGHCIEDMLVALDEAEGAADGATGAEA